MHWPGSQQQGRGGKMRMRSGGGVQHAGGLIEGAVI